MDIGTIRTIFASTINKFLQIFFFLKAQQNQQQMPEEAQEQQQQLQLINQLHAINRDLTMTVIGFCLASAVDIALQAIQIKPQLISALPCLSLQIFFAFVVLLIARYINVKFPLTARALEWLGILSAASAFCYAINIPFPLRLKWTTWTVFAISLLVIFVCNRFF